MHHSLEDLERELERQTLATAALQIQLQAHAGTELLVDPAWLEELESLGAESPAGMLPVGVLRA